MHVLPETKTAQKNLQTEANEQYSPARVQFCENEPHRFWKQMCTIEKLSEKLRSNMTQKEVNNKRAVRKRIHFAVY